MIGPEKTLKAVPWNYNPPPQAAHWQLLQSNEPVDRPHAHAEHSSCLQLTHSQCFWFSFQD
jgi:hypothetical protein